MEHSDLATMHELNRVLLARNLANADANFSPAILAISGMLMGVGAFALLLGIFRGLGV